MKNLLLTIITLVGIHPVFCQIDSTFLIAIQSNDLDKVKELVVSGVDIHAVDENGANTLMWAAYASDLEMMKFFAEKEVALYPKGAIYVDAQKNGYYGNLLSIAAAFDKVATLQYLIEEKGIPIDDKEYNVTEGVKNGWTALQWAASAGALKSVEYLIDKKAILTLDSDSAIFHAFNGGHNAIVDILMDYDAQQNSKRKDYSLLHYAASANQVDIIHYFQEQQFNLDTQIVDGVTALMLAAEGGHLESCFWLDYYDVNVNIRDNQGKVALKYAIGKESSECNLFLQQSSNYFNEKIAFSCNNRAESLIHKGEYLKGVDITKVSLLHIRKTLGEESSEYANSLSDLAVFYLSLLRYDDALPLFEQALIITEKTLGKEDIQYGYKTYSLAVLYQQVGKDREAIPLFESSKLLFSRYLGENHPEYANLLNYFATSYQVQGEYDEALLLIEEALRIIETAYGRNHIEFAFKLLSKGSLISELGNYEQALSLCNQTLIILENQPNRLHPDYYNILNQIAIIYHQLGNYPSALSLYYKGLSFFEKTYGKKNFEYAQRLNNIGALHDLMGDSEKAKSKFKEALILTEETLGVEHYEYANILNNLGLIYRKEKEYDKAIASFEKVLEISGKSKRTKYLLHALYLNNLAITQSDIGNQKLAIYTYESALKIIKESVGENHPEYAKSLHNLATIYRDIGKYEKAVSLFEEALSKTKETLGDGHFNYGAYLENFSIQYQLIGKYSEAEAVLIQLDENFKAQNNSIKYLGEVIGKNTLQTVIRFNEHIQSFVFRDKSMFLRGSCFINNLEIKNQLLYNKKELLKLINTAEDSILIEQGLKWVNNQKIISYQYTLPVNKRVKKLDSIIDLTNQLENELSFYIKDFKKANEPLVVQDFKKTLLKNEAILEISHFNYHNINHWTDSILYVAYLVCPNTNEVQQIFLFEKKELEQSASKASSIKKLYTRGAVRLSKKAKKLELIWKRLLPHLSPYNTLYVSPSGLLNEVNLGAIPISKDSLAMDKFKIYQYSSLKSLIYKDEETMEEKDFLLIGGINYDSLDNSVLDTVVVKQEEFVATIDNSTYVGKKIRGLRGTTTSKWNYLDGTKEEVNNIGNLLKTNEQTYQLLSDKYATEDKIKTLLSQPKSPSVLHIATHGFFFPDVEKDNSSNQDKIAFEYSDDPMIRSGLILAGANHAWANNPTPLGQEDGILTAKEVSNLNLRNTELVVLSACETGLGEHEGTEGVYGLQRAFKMAGAKNLLISLWSVPDKETQELMTTFYNNWLTQKMSIRDAFYAAQQEMRIKHKDPLKWAGFILIE